MAGEQGEEQPKPKAVGIGPVLVPARAVQEEEEAAIVHGPVAMCGENPWMEVTPPPQKKSTGVPCSVAVATPYGGATEPRTTRCSNGGRAGVAGTGLTGRGSLV